MSLKAATEGLRGKRILVTGGAGFIGSNLTKYLLEHDLEVVVLDNFLTGHKKNIEAFFDHPGFTFIEGDITNRETCEKALNGVDLVSHQAALGSVPRSIEYPHKTHEINATGFLNMLHAAKEKGIMRFVYASSSSVYGDSTVSPKVVGSEGKLLSPYAVTKQLNEMYAAVYATLHGMQTIGLRYFNVFGPNQDPKGVYAAAIPKFVDKMINGETLTINGDGEQTRDFTYVENAVKANVLALNSENSAVFGKVFNVACGEKFSLNKVIDEIKANLIRMGVYNENCTIVNGPERTGDIRHSLADITSTEKYLEYSELTKFKRGITEYLEALIKNYERG